MKSRRRFRSRFSRRNRSVVQPVQQVEVLENRSLLTVVLDPIGVSGDGVGFLPDLGDGKTMFVPLTAIDSDGGEVTFEVTASDPGITVTILPPSRSIRVNFSGVDASNNAFQGDLTLRLFEDDAPLTTQAIIDLIESGFYDVATDGNSQIAHRVVEDFVLQFGDPTGTGSGDGTVEERDDEYNPDLTFTGPGLLAMAKTTDDTNASQVFITDVDLPLADQPDFLNFQHTIFGVMTSGFDTYRSIMSTPVDGGDRPLTDIVLNSIEVIDDTQNGVVRIEADEGYSGVSAVTITASNAALEEDSVTFDIDVVTDTNEDPPILGVVQDVETATNSEVTFTIDAIDLEDDDLTFTVVESGTSNVTIESVTFDQSPTDGATATVVVLPGPDFQGDVTLLATVSDGRTGDSLTDNQEFTLSVNPNTQPIATAATVTVDIETNTVLTLTGESGEAENVEQTLTFAITREPDNGEISNFDATTGQFEYRPDAGFTGTDSLEFTVTDSGGTTGGGVDTSEPAVLTMNVADLGTTFVPRLRPEDDTGRSDSDNFTSDNTWTLEIEAEPDAVVDFLVNGTTILALESSETPGFYSAEIDPLDVEEGVNSVTAIQSANGETTTSREVEIYFAPDESGIYTVPGDGTEEVTLSFAWLDGVSSFNQELGFFIVNDDDGSITRGGQTYRPGDPDYILEALRLPTLAQPSEGDPDDLTDDVVLPTITTNTRFRLFGRGTGPGRTTDVVVREGDRLVFYLIANSYRDQFIRINPSNKLMFHGALNTYTSLQAANPDGAQHMQQLFDFEDDTLLMQWEDMWATGDSDFNDAIFSLVPSTADAAITPGESYVIPAGENSTIELEFDLVQQEGSDEFADGEFGYFPVDNATGAVNGASPGTSTWLTEVSAVSQVLFEHGDDIRTPERIDVTGGRVGFYYVPTGLTLAEVAADNPTNDPAIGPVAYFSFDAANPDDRDRITTNGLEAYNASTRRFVSDEINLDLNIGTDITLRIRA